MKYLISMIIALCVSDLYADNTVIFFNGTVTYQSQGSSQWRNVKTGQKIMAGDTVQTGENSIAEINTDQNIIKIRPKTKVTFSTQVVDEKPRGTLSLFIGSVNCILDKLKKSGGGYNVNTPAAVCSVRGTSFDVATSADGKTYLQVTDGTVAMSGISQSVNVSKDQESAVALGGEPEPVKIIKRQNWEKWANEVSTDVKGKEREIIAGCLVKVKKLDTDIIQLERESEDAMTKYKNLGRQSAEAKLAGDEKTANELAGNAERSRRVSFSRKNMAAYQASRIILVKEVADHAYNSSDDKGPLKDSYDVIDQIYTKYFLKYIKPIIDSVQLRQEIRDRKKKNK
jgi:hypothetical protein